jgi:uncharacterized protein YciI
MEKMQTPQLVFMSAFMALAMSLAHADERPIVKITWIFLNTGAERDKAKNMPKEEVSKMQADHVGNFGTQFNLGKLFAAGPLGDNGFIRGIVILNANTAEQVAECFKPDPFVQNGILEAEAHPCLAELMAFGSPKIPFKMTRYTLCILKKGKNWQPASSPPKGDSLFHLFPEFKSKRRSAELAISGTFLDSSDKLGILMFYSTNQAQIKADLENTPAVRQERVEIELHPQFIGAGTFRDKSDAPPKPAKHLALFDGKTFNGWERDTQKTWRINKGSLIGGSLSETVPHNDFLSTTKEFKNFDLRLKVKLTGTGFINGGIQVRSQRMKDPAFEMIGYQADMGEGYWGSLYDESRRNKALAHPHAALMKQVVKADDWNEYIIRCEDKHIRLWLNGVLTVDYTEDDKEIPLTGLIGLQIHGGGKAEASYKDIMIQELP